MDAIGFSAMNVEQMLAQCADFPQPGHPPKKVGDRWYPRYSSDAVPALVKDAVSRLKAELEVEGKLKATGAKAQRSALNRLVNELWPFPHRGSETSKMQAAQYVRDWASEHGIEVTLPDKKEE